MSLKSSDELIGDLMDYGTVADIFAKYGEEWFRKSEVSSLVRSSLLSVPNSRFIEEIGNIRRFGDTPSFGCFRDSEGNREIS
uniref:Uncharacterized protein n=1 Tax=Physcomitrium patens TaxID=3218 RepID=A0A7I4A2G6_PHYPA